MVNILVYSSDPLLTGDIVKILKTRKEKMNVYYSHAVTGLVMFNASTRDMDIIVMVIESKSDVAAARRYKVYNYKSMIIFIVKDTALLSALHKIESYRCLEFPDTRDVAKALENAFERIAYQRTVFFTYKKKKSTYCVNLDNVMYFYSTHKTVNIKMNGEPEENYNGKLDDVQAQIENYCNTFIRINKSYYLNKKYITHEYGDSIKMADGVVVSFSRNARKKKELT